MASSTSKKRRTESDNAASSPASSPPTDVISTLLPDCVLASILSLLPFKESVRTSVLSSRWRHLWTLAPIDIHIDDGDINAGDPDNPLPRKLGRKSRRRWMQSRLDAVADILSRHRGPIRSFGLSDAIWRRLLDSCQLDRSLELWAESLVQKSIGELTVPYKLPPLLLLTCPSLRSLNLVNCKNLDGIPALPPNLMKLKLRPYACSDSMNRTKLPLALASCRSLCFLELCWYDLKDPLNVPLPPYLRELSLRKTNLTPSVLSHVLSGCRYLDSLCLEEHEYIANVCIRSLSIRRLTFKGYRLSNIIIEDAPKLEHLMFEGANLKVVNAPKLQVSRLNRWNRWLF